MRFLHLADLHLDTPFAGRTPELRKTLRDASHEALSRAISLALSERVDALLIAGDLFDGESLSYGTERLLIQELGRLSQAGIPTLYATGNHDPGSPGGAARRMEWPEGVTVFSEPEPRRVPVYRGQELRGWVTGAGHPSSRESSDLSRAFPRPQGSLPEVALLHTQVTGAGGAEDHDRYAPSELPFLRSTGFDYWALGHIHLREELSQSPPIHYPGNLQGRSPRETGAKGGLLVDLSRKSDPQLQFVELARVRWERVALTLTEEEATPPALVRRIREEWSALRAPDPGLSGGEWLLRVELSGVTPLARRLRNEDDLREVELEVKETLGLLDAELRVGSLRPPLHVEEHQDRPDVLGGALRLAQELSGRRSSESGEEPLSLLGIGVDELAGLPDGDSPERYLAELLAEGDRALLERMRGGDE